MTHKVHEGMPRLPKLQKRCSNIRYLCFIRYITPRYSPNAQVGEDIKGKLSILSSLFSHDMVQFILSEHFGTNWTKLKSSIS